MQKYTSIGFTKKLYGTQGGVRITVKDLYLDALLTTNCVFLAIEGNKIPFFIKKIIQQPPLRILFEDHLDRNAAQQLTGKELFLSDHQLPTKQEETINFTRLIDFTLKDTEKGIIGPILSIEEFPQQLMAFVLYQEEEILIPLHTDLIDHIDLDNQLIIVHLPEGLLEL